MHDTNAPTNPARAGRVAILLPALSAAIWTALSGCSSTPEAAGPTEIIRAEALDRDTEAARRLTARGTELLAEGKYEQAESVLREACRHDLYFGPARNNLGLAYFHRGKYYEAAWEFDHAATLMPHQVEPRHNLGMVFEETRQFPRAALWYEKALEIAPDALAPRRHLARTYARTHRNLPRLRELLGQLVFRDEDTTWRNWARQTLLTLPEEAQEEAANSDWKPPFDFDQVEAMMR